MGDNPGSGWLDTVGGTQQLNHGRRDEYCGLNVNHTSEGVKDDVGPDSGTDVLGSFIRNRPRTNPGSYHDTVDSDSALQLVGDDDEAFHVGVDHWNWSTWSLAFVCRTTDLRPDDPWTQMAISIAGRRHAGVWTRKGFCVQHSARFLTRAECFDLKARRPRCPHGLRLGGMTHHGVLQPGDRSDAMVTNPHRDELERMLVDAILATLAPASVPQRRRRSDMLHIANPGTNYDEYFDLDPNGVAMHAYEHDEGMSPWVALSQENRQPHAFHGLSAHVVPKGVPNAGAVIVSGRGEFGTEDANPWIKVRLPGQDWSGWVALGPLKAWLKATSKS
jgi:hypothetical protein